MKRSILQGTTLLLISFFAVTGAWGADKTIGFAYLGKPDPHKAAYTTGVVNFAHLLEKRERGKNGGQDFPGGDPGQ